MIIMGSVLALAAVLTVLQGGPAPAPAENVLFSWKAPALEEQAPELFAAAAAQGIDAVYQAVPSDSAPETLAAFTGGAAQAGLSVYLLDGDPSWGLDRTGREMRAVVARAADYNAAHPDAPLAGVALDVEPYLTEAWDEEPERVLDSFVRGLTAAYRDAGEENLHLAVCVPFFYDSKGYTQEINRITEQCDTLVVMNYQRGHEAENIRTELLLARLAGRQLVTAYELQPAGTHGLTARNTYREAGLDALHENFAAVQAQLGPGSLGFALHDWASLREVLNDE